MTCRPVPGWFVVPAQPVRRDRPPPGSGWVHEIKHDGYRVLVRRDGAVVRVYSRNAVNWTDRFSTIAAVAATLEARSFTIDGEAVVIGPDGIAQFDQLQRRNGAKRAMLYGFDLIELDGVDLRSRPLLERKTALAELIDGTKSGIMLNDHLAEDGDLVFAHACRLGAEGIVSKKIDASYCSGPHSAWIKTKNPASIAVQRERNENWHRR
jgi:bifunctional non-homologous end joining protein LigD